MFNVKFINWDKSLEINNAVIDQQHFHMAELLNEIKSILNSNTPEKADTYAARLLDHIKIHFDTEEDIMTKLKYPGYYSHKLEHNRMLAESSLKLQKIIDGKDSFDKNYLIRLKQWFINHIELNDKKLGVFLNS